MKKRERDEEAPLPATGPSSGSGLRGADATQSMDYSRNIAGSKRLPKESVSAAMVNYQQQTKPIQSLLRPQQLQQHQLPRSQYTEFLTPPPLPPIRTLPVSSDELGRIPLHTQQGYSPHEERTSLYNSSTHYWDGSGGSESISPAISSSLDNRSMMNNHDIYTSNMRAIPSFPIDNAPYDQMAMHYPSAGQFTQPASFSSRNTSSAYPITIQSHAETSAHSHHQAISSQFSSTSQLPPASPEDAAYAMWSNAPPSFE